MSPVYRVYANPLQTFSGPVPSNLNLVQDFHREHSQKGQFQHLGSKGAQSLSGTSSKMLCRFLDTSADHFIVQAQWHQECNSSWSLGTFFSFFNKGAPDGIRKLDIVCTREQYSKPSGTAQMVIQRFTMTGN